MTEDLPRTPEGDLIRRARDRAVPKLSIRAAAARIGISPEHWGNVERGYKSAGADEEPRRLDISPALIAKMALAVGVTPEQLETTGKRPDAAEELREIQRRDPVPLADPAGAPRAVPPVPARREIPFHAAGVTEEDLQPYISEIRQAAYGILVSLFGDQVPAPPDPGAEVAIAALPGRLLFPGDDEFARLEAEAWDKTPLTLGEKVKIIAIGRFLAGLAAGEQGRRTGLGPAVTQTALHALEPAAGKPLRASS